MYATIFRGEESQKELFCCCNLTQEKRLICMGVLILDELIRFSEILNVVIFATFLFIFFYV